MPDLAASNALWEYACKVYQLPEIQKICLRMQDCWNADVNVLLAAGWAARQGKEPDWSAILPLVNHWQEEIVCPLRKLRKKLNKNSAIENHIRIALLAVELDTEKAELAQLFQWLNGQAEQKNLANHPLAQLTSINLASYLQLLERPPDGELINLLADQLSYWLCHPSDSLTDI